MTYYSFFLLDAFSVFRHLYMQYFMHNVKIHSKIHYEEQIKCVGIEEMERDVLFF